MQLFKDSIISPFRQRCKAKFVLSFEPFDAATTTTYIKHADQGPVP